MLTNEQRRLAEVLATSHGWKKKPQTRVLSQVSSFLREVDLRPPDTVELLHRACDMALHDANQPETVPMPIATGASDEEDVANGVYGLSLLAANLTNNQEDAWKLAKDAMEYVVGFFTDLRSLSHEPSPDPNNPARRTSRPAQAPSASSPAPAPAQQTRQAERPTPKRSQRSSSVPDPRYFLPSEQENPMWGFRDRSTTFSLPSVSPETARAPSPPNPPVESVASPAAHPPAARPPTAPPSTTLSLPGRLQPQSSSSAPPLAIQADTQAPGLACAPSLQARRETVEPHRSTTLRTWARGQRQEETPQIVEQLTGLVRDLVQAHTRRGGHRADEGSSSDSADEATDSDDDASTDRALQRWARRTSACARNHNFLCAWRAHLVDRPTFNDAVHRLLQDARAQHPAEPKLRDASDMRAIEGTLGHVHAALRHAKPGDHRQRYHLHLALEEQLRVLGLLYLRFAGATGESFAFYEKKLAEQRQKLRRVRRAHLFFADPMDLLLEARNQSRGGQQGRRQQGQTAPRTFMPRPQTTQPANHQSGFVPFPSRR